MVINEADEAEVRALLQRLNEAWGNADVYAALFTEDADYITFDGSPVSRRVVIGESHRHLLAGLMRGSRLVARTTAVRFLTPDVAVVHGKGAVIQRRQKEASRRAVSVQTTVVARQDGHWLITAFQNTRYRPWTESLLGKMIVRLNERRWSRTSKAGS